MSEPLARLRLVRPFKNQSCPYCTGRTLMPPREQRRAGSGHMTEVWAEEWDLSGSRYPGWYLHLVFHGLREQTQTLQMLLRLEGVDEGANGCPAYAQVIEPRQYDRERFLYGSVSTFRSGEEPSPVVRVGSHLVMELDFMGRFRKVTTVLPIAHLLHWFTNSGVG